MTRRPTCRPTLGPTWPPAACLLAACLLAAGAGGAPATGGGTGTGAVAAPRLLDSFARVGTWRPAPADGVTETLSAGEGFRGSALRLDFAFTGGGWAIAHRDLDPPLVLPANYEFRFRLRGEAPVNTLEFKLIDPSGQNVWWSVRRDLAWPAQWETVRIKKRHLAFAWGPAGGGEIDTVAAIEFAVTAGQGGGKGTVWLDELELVPLAAVDGPPPAPVASASSAAPGHAAALAIDGDAATSWAAAAGDPEPRLELDLGREREFSALGLAWAPGRGASTYVVEARDEEGEAGTAGGDGGAGGRGDRGDRAAPDEGWRELAQVTGGNGGRDLLFLPDAEARRLRLRILDVGPGDDAAGAAAAPGAPALAELTIEPLDWAATREDFFARLASEVRRGLYPRAYVGQQQYWTVVGVDNDPREALLSEDGALEAGPGRFSIEPFLWRDGRLVTWADAGIDHALADDRLPIPSLTWRAGDLELRVTAFGDGPPDSSGAIARYGLRNRGDEPATVTFYLAVRPFQVDPPTQWLNHRGGTAPIHALALSGGDVVEVDGEPAVRCLTPPVAWGATAFGGGEIVAEHLASGRLPAAAAVEDPFAAASGALAWPFVLAPGEERTVAVAVPLHPGFADRLPGAAAAAPWVEQRLAAARAAWTARLGGVEITVPPAARELLDAMWAQVGWILVDRAGPALQPGTRSYARSWIRDGALTGSALLRLGLDDVVTDFLDWYAPYQAPDGKVPCVVDARGADPTPEHDSSGELIFLVAEHLRLTGDRALAERMWPHVRAAAAYLDSLRHLRLTPAYDEPDQVEFRGLLPPSISHEGYSARPMHSYWDDLFALRGFRDAAWLAGELGHADAAARLDATAADFARDLRASVEATMRRHDIAYMPGCADLGDFDATSTTIALRPLGLQDALPAGALRATFDRYVAFFQARAEGAGDQAGWTAYTPYEIRNVGALASLGMRQEAQQALAFFLADRRPPGWRQWPEVIRRDPREPGFLGDLPHGWVASDYVRSFLDLLAYADLGREALVLMAGVPPEWFEPPQAGGAGSSAASGLEVRGLRTPWGPLSYTAAREGKALVIMIESGLRPPPGGLVIRPPAAGSIRSVTIDGVAARAGASGEIVVPRAPARIVLKP